MDRLSVNPQQSEGASPEWIYKRDGRLVAFEADKISRCLFAANEALGTPDPFKARELTDVVLHFISKEFDRTIPTTPQIREWVVKVVRELGQPQIAQEYSIYDRQRKISSNGAINRDTLKRTHFG